MAAEFRRTMCSRPLRIGGLSRAETYGQTSSTLQVSNIHMRGYNFATPGYLKRHEREVHATPTYVCPVTSCKRNRRGFSRKDNLVQHMRRTHDQGGDTMNTSSPSPPASSLATALRIGEMTTDQVNETGSVNVDEDSAIQLEVSTSVSSDKFSLIAKLQELETAKEKATAKFDGDIDALKRVLSFM
ncbi:hypothetical protein BDZ45DRAFT_222814 [Acephala macrosclerotiorum]|nr:hypothetical protein BDZ45DRAFT_222814 [Acephala macrosclerotiorum]